MAKYPIIIRDMNELDDKTGLRMYKENILYPQAYTVPKSVIEEWIISLGGGGGGGDFTESDLINTSRTFNKGQSAAITALTSSGGNVSVDLEEANMWSLTLTESTSILNPTTDSPTTGIIIGNQDGTGNWTLSFGVNWTVLGDDIPTAPNSKFHISYYSNGAGRLVAIINDETI